MPQQQSVSSLRSLALLSLAKSVASAIIRCLELNKTNSANCLARKKKTRKRREESPVLFLPSKELSRMKLYLVNARPKQSKQELFQEVLKVFTSLLCFKSKTSSKKKLGRSFTETVDDFEQGLGNIFDMFLQQSDIRSLNFINVHHLVMNWVDSSRLSNNNPDYESVMNHGQVEKALLRALSERADKLSTIEELIWPHLVSGELLRLVGRHCKSLQVLILSCECQVAGRDEDENTFTLMSSNTSWEDDFVKALECLYGRSPGHFDGIDRSRGCPKLKKLVLPHIEDEKGSATTVMANVLTVLTNLEYVSGIPMLSILMKYKGKSKALDKLQLKNICDHDLYMRRSQPNEHYLKSLLPKLETIDIVASEAITRKLSETFPSITTLKVHWPNVEEHTKLFSNLEKLDLVLDYRCVWQLLRNIGYHCKKIKSITLRQPTMVVSADHEEGVPPPRIPTLEHFQLIRSSFIEFTAFKNFLKGAPNITNLEVTLSNDRNYIVDEFTDRLILSVSPYLTKLECFTVECLYRYNLCMHLNCILTLDTVHELIRQCPNLTRIGHLDSWDVTDEQVDDLQQYIKARNMKLEVLW